jgi:hypothetical protein
VGIVLVFFFIGSSTASQKPGYDLTVSGQVTARNLYPIAEAAAQEWEADTLFVSASATWTNASIAEFEQPVDWVYRFYSPGQQRILFVIVTGEQQVIVQPHIDSVRRELRLIDPDTWQVDSPDAIIGWLNNGGGPWLQQASSRVVSAQLAFDIAENRPRWSISALNPDTGQTFRYIMMAN